VGRSRPPVRAAKPHPRRRAMKTLEFVPVLEKACRPSGCDAFLSGRKKETPSRLGASPRLGARVSSSSTSRPAGISHEEVDGMSRLLRRIHTDLGDGRCWLVEHHMGFVMGQSRTTVVVLDFGKKEESRIAGGQAQPEGPAEPEGHRSLPGPPRDCPSGARGTRVRLRGRRRSSPRPCPLVRAGKAASSLSSAPKRAPAKTNHPFAPITGGVPWNRGEDFVFAGHSLRHKATEDIVQRRHRATSPRRQGHPEPS